MDGKVASLARLRLLDGWRLSELRRLARAADVVDLSPGELLMRAGKWHAGCYILMSGAVATTTTDGSRLITAAGEFVGLAETLADVVTQGETVALRTTTALAFMSNGFIAALEDLKPLRRLALTQLAVAQVAPRRTGPKLSLAIAH